MEKQLDEYIAARWNRLSDLHKRLLGLDRIEYRTYLLALWTKQFYELQISQIKPNQI